MVDVPVMRNAVDAYVSERYPNKNYSSTTRLYLADWPANDTRFAYIYFGLPAGMKGTSLVSAKLRVNSGEGFGGTVTMSVQPVSAKFSVNKITFANRPSVTGTPVSVTKTNAPLNTMWEFDITAHLQQVANGAPWYGFRIAATGQTPKWIFAADSRTSTKPEILISWSDAPDRPEDLTPDDGAAVSVSKPTLRWKFTDPSGDTTMQSFYLRMFSTEALALANGTGDVLDLQRASTVPSVDLTTTSYAGLAENATVWWRVQNVDGAGIQSEWSDVAYFTRKGKGTVTITNPPTTGVISDPTPPFMWTFSGTQAAYQVLLSTPSRPVSYFWNSGIVNSTGTAHTPPSGKITQVGGSYRVTVRVYDDVDRAATPGDPAYVEATRDFVFQLATGVTPPTGLTLTTDGFYPRARLDWTMTTVPDHFVILRDGVVVDEVEPQDVLVSGTSYRYYDYTPRPRTNYTWAVAAKVNGAVSTGNPTVTGKVRIATTTLSDPVEGGTLFLFNPEIDADRAETSDVHYVLGDAPPIVISQSLRGYEGTAGGVLTDNVVPGVTAADQLEVLEGIRDAPGRQLVLVWVDRVMKVVVRSVTDRPIARADGGVDYLVSFEFFQVDR